MARCLSHPASTESAAARTRRSIRLSQSAIDSMSSSYVGFVDRASARPASPES
jgi:hypothetical protein